MSLFLRKSFKKRGKNALSHSIEDMTKLRKRTTLKEDMGKMLFEVGRIALGGVVIVVLLRGELPDDILLIGGCAVVAASFISSLILGKREIKTDKTLLHRRKRGKR